MNTSVPIQLPVHEADAEAASAYAVTDHLPCVAFRLLHPNTDWPPAFSYLSAQSSELLGVEPHIIVLDASVLFDRIPQEDAVPLQAGITHAFATMGQWQHEVRLRSANTVRWFECRGRVHRLSTSALCADGYLTDITAHKLADLERTGLYQRLVCAFEGTPNPWQS